jgi:2-hydroxychromene-2-carboxylate isomerase
VLNLAGPPADLAVLAERAARHDPTCLARVTAHGAVAAVFVATPFECLGMRAVRLTEPQSLDVVVEAVGLAARARAASEHALDLPPALAPVLWTLPLPPRAGWTAVGTLPSADVADRVRHDTDEFQRRAAAVPAGRGASALVEAVARDLWARPLVGDHPARLAHAADYLGFVADAGDVTVRSAGVWRRLDTPAGVTLARVTDPLGLLVR